MSTSRLIISLVKKNKGKTLLYLWCTDSFVYYSYRGHPEREALTPASPNKTLRVTDNRATLQQGSIQAHFYDQVDFLFYQQLSTYKQRNLPEIMHLVHMKWLRQPRKMHMQLPLKEWSYMQNWTTLNTKIPPKLRLIFLVSNLRLLVFHKINK